MTGTGTFSMNLHTLLSNLLIGLILLILAVVNALELEDYMFTREVCDKHLYYDPYVKVSKTRKGPTVVGIYSTGFLDLRNYSGLLCINGPAFLYTGKEDSTFTKAVPKLFQHNCLGFNRLNISAYKDVNEHPLYIDSTTVVYGYKVLGVFLLAAPKDFRKSEFISFPKPNYQYKDPTDSSVTLVNGSSFAIVVNDGGKINAISPDPPEIVEPANVSSNAHCFKASSPKNASIAVQGLISADVPINAQPKFCYLNEPDSFTDFEMAFKINLTMERYEWSACDPNSVNGVDGGGIGGTGSSDDPKNLPDFRAIVVDPTGGGPALVLKPPPNSALLPNPFLSQTDTDPDPGSTVDDETGALDRKFVSTVIQECEDVQPLTPDCGENASVTDCSSNDNLLHWVLTVEPEEPVWDNPNLAKAKWRREIFIMIEEIYKKICPMVSRSLAPSIMRVMEYFISKVADIAITPPAAGVPDDQLSEGAKKYVTLNDDPLEPKPLELMNENRNLMRVEFTKCLSSATRMEFYKIKDYANEVKKKLVEWQQERFARNLNANISRAALDEILLDNTVMHPYRIFASSPQYWKRSDLKLEIFTNIEAAEVDYDLDWAIDTFWKIFSTVLGYCNPLYDDTINDKQTILEMIYSQFTSDVMDLIKEQWTQDGGKRTGGQSFIFGNYEKQYDKIFGEFKNGGVSRYIDACHEGAYWLIEHLDLRAVRPIYLKYDTEVKEIDDITNATTTKVVPTFNFFIERPPFYPKTNNSIGR